MKRVLCVALLCAAADAASPAAAAVLKPIAPHGAAAPAKKPELRGAKKPDAAKAKAKKDKDVANVPAQLSQMMAQAQQTLAVAEKHHEKVVEKERGLYTDMLSKEASVMGKAILNYTQALDRGIAILQTAVNNSKAQLALKEPPTEGFASALVQARARLSAETDSAEREVRRDQRKREHAFHQAVSDAGSAMEEGSQKLSRKTGDVSQLLDDSKASLESIAEGRVMTDDSDTMSDADWDAQFDADGNPIVANATNATNATKAANATKAVNSTHAKNATNATKAPEAPLASEPIMKAALAQMKAAKEQSKAVAAAAEKQLAADLKQGTADVTKAVADIMKDLVVAQKKEIDRVRGKSSTIV
mmetsp:Transcript_71450/g.209805  ORF Transcript_71450/g.209805 Transcript_71450/m.209805 type:complete len:360 (+) Transcript_71450:70-1149(+)